MAQALSLSGLFGIAAAATPTVLGTRFGRMAPLLIASLALGAVTYGFGFIGSSTGFWMGTAADMFLMIFIWPYYTGVVAALDPRGRLGSLGAAVQLVGFAAGPFLVVRLLDARFDLLFLGAANLSVGAAVLMLLSARRSSPSA